MPNAALIRKKWLRFAPWALLIAAPLLIAGWVLPIMSVTSFWVIETEHSVIGGLKTFINEGEWLLVLIIGLFAVLFPASKVIIGIFAWIKPDRAKLLLRAANTASKWSMLDVFVIALVVMTAKSSVVADAHVGIGAWCFSAAAIASTLALYGLRRRQPGR
jgi:paraquat-inducible protein A